MAENRRKTHVNAILRNKRFLEAERFMQENRAYLLERLSLLRTSYAGFTDEHQNLVSILSNERFEQQDAYFEEIEEIYRNIVTRFSQRIEELTVLEKARNVQIENTSNQVQVRHNSSKERNSSANDNLPVRERENVRANVVRNNMGTKLKRIRSVISRPIQDLRERLQGNDQNRIQCHHCGSNHKMHNCESFKALNLESRLEAVFHLKLCRNCLMQVPYQRTHTCKYGPCKRCGKSQFHNSLLCPKTN